MDFSSSSSSSSSSCSPTSSISTIRYSSTSLSSHSSPTNLQSTPMEVRFPHHSPEEIEGASSIDYAEIPTAIMESATPPLEKGGHVRRLDFDAEIKYSTRPRPRPRHPAQIKIFELTNGTIVEHLSTMMENSEFAKIGGEFCFPPRKLTNFPDGFPPSPPPPSPVSSSLEDAFERLGIRANRDPCTESDNPHQSRLCVSPPSLSYDATFGYYIPIGETIPIGVKSLYISREDEGAYIPPEDEWRYSTWNNQSDQERTSPPTSVPDSFQDRENVAQTDLDEMNEELGFDPFKIAEKALAEDIRLEKDLQRQQMEEQQYLSDTECRHWSGRR